jgi:hypothetical protein
MALSPQVREELQRLGPATVRARLATSPPNSQGRQQIVLIGPQGLYPARGDVEDWLREQDEEIDRRSASRHREGIKVGQEAVIWARRAFWAAVISIVIAVVVGLLSLKHG